ncbi:hypothetical protein QR98_0014600 [Sarcoptes scabiei]|uniref:Uncharacterized protein n=1 Tax=Sarcoptes scabiei TaxID=52283 RepID=A0A131ZWJ8_SARSC|nr:hypothetical protein QR98_0014600 [Sarcoptes scabiei]
MFAKSIKSFTLFSITLVLFSKIPNSYGIWPFTSWSKPSSSVTSTLTDIFLRPYVEDLTALPSESSPQTSEFVSPAITFENNLKGSNGYQSEHFEQQAISDATTDQQSQWSMSRGQSSSLSNQQVGSQQQQLQQQPHWSSQPTTQFGYQQTSSAQMQDILNHFVDNQAANSKLYGTKTKFSPSFTTENAGIVQSPSSRFPPTPVENQYLIVRKTVQPLPVSGTSQFQQVEKYLDSNKFFQQSQQPSNVVSNQYQSNNWEYVAPVSKPIPQQQVQQPPLILEAFLEQENPQQTPIQTATKGIKVKPQSSHDVSGGYKFPIFSWLTNSSQLHLPSWLKGKQQDYRPASDVQIVQQRPTTTYYYPSSSSSSAYSDSNGNYQNFKTTYVYPSKTVSMNPVSNENHHYQTNTNTNANDFKHQEIKTVAQTTSSTTNNNNNNNVGPTQAIWIATDNVQSNPSWQQTQQAQTQYYVPTVQNQQFWTEIFREPGRIQFQSPIVRQIATPSQVTQVESNQDLGGWESISMPETIKPSSASAVTSLKSIQQDEIQEPSMLSVSTEPLNYETSSNNVTNRVVSQSSNQTPQPSHRVVYQTMNQSTSSGVQHTNTTSNPIDTNVMGRSFNAIPSSQFNPVYQFNSASIQTSAGNDNVAVPNTSN